MIAGILETEQKLGIVEIVGIVETAETLGIVETVEIAETEMNGLVDHLDIKETAIIESNNNIKALLVTETDSHPLLHLLLMLVNKA